MRKQYTFSLLFILIGLGLFAQDLSNRMLFTARLSGMNNTTVNNPNAVGIANLFLSSNRDTLYFNLAVGNVGNTLSSVHIQAGPAGSDGPSLVIFDSTIVDNKLNATITDSTLSTLLPLLISEDLYVNVYDNTNPAAGSARGQIKLERDFGFFANPDTAQEVPVTSGGAIASANFKLDQTEDSLTVKVVCSGLSGPITGIHLHQGIVGENGPVILDLSPLVEEGSRIDSIIEIPEELEGDLAALVKSGRVYLNIHTAAFPNGEIRGQAKSSTDLYFDFYASNDNLAAPQTSASNIAAAGHAYINSTFDTLRYFAVYEIDSLSSNPVITAFTTNGAPTKTLTPENGIISGVWTSTDATPLTIISINALLQDQVGFTMNTLFNPAGEMSGTLNRAMRDAYVFDLDTNQVVDTLNLEKRPLGAGMISVNTRGTHAHYMMAYDSLSSDVSSAPLYLGVAGERGPLILGLDRVNGGAFGYLRSNDGFNPTVTAQMQADSVYIAVGTLNHPVAELSLIHI